MGGCNAAAWEGTLSQRVTAQGDSSALFWVSGFTLQTFCSEVAVGSYKNSVRELQVVWEVEGQRHTLHHIIELDLADRSELGHSRSRDPN